MRLYGIYQENLVRVRQTLRNKSHFDAITRVSARVARTSVSRKPQLMSLLFPEKFPIHRNLQQRRSGSRLIPGDIISQTQKKIISPLQIRGQSLPAEVALSAPTRYGSSRNKFRNHKKR